MKIFLFILCIPMVSLASLSFKNQPDTFFIELYASQGCSSCPPMERWLNSFSNNKQLWKKIIPLHFHVDYWDYLGWTDSFTNKKATQRQYQYVVNKVIKNAYTPCIIINGQEQKQLLYGKG